jgi:hypothetical protein
MAERRKATGAICRSLRSGSKAGASAHRTWCSSCRCPSRSRRAASSTISTSSSRRTSLKTAGFRRRKYVPPSGRSCITSSRSSASRNRSGSGASRPVSSSRRRRSALMKRRKPARCPAIFWSATRRASRRRFCGPDRGSSSRPAQTSCSRCTTPRTAMRGTIAHGSALSSPNNLRQSAS